VGKFLLPSGNHQKQLSLKVPEMDEYQSIFSNCSDAFAGGPFAGSPRIFSPFDTAYRFYHPYFIAQYRSEKVALDLDITRTGLTH
jgi:hypothetical protein